MGRGPFTKGKSLGKGGVRFASADKGNLPLFPLWECFFSTVMADFRAPNKTPGISPKYILFLFSKTLEIGCANDFCDREKRGEKNTQGFSKIIMGQPRGVRGGKHTSLHHTKREMETNEAVATVSKTEIYSAARHKISAFPK